MMSTIKPDLIAEFEQDEPELYHLSLHCQRFPDGRRWYHDVRLELFRPEPIKLPQEILDRFGCGVGDDYAAYYLGDSFFTTAEADAIERWLTRLMEPGDTLERRRATLAVPANVMPVSGIPCGGGVDHHMFSRYADFDCPVPFWGHYDLRFSKSYLGCDACGCDVAGVPTVKIRSACPEGVFGQSRTYCATCFHHGAFDIPKVLDALSSLSKRPFGSNAFVPVDDDSGDAVFDAMNSDLPDWDDGPF